jgi:CRP-like cAMP-binding protein
VRDRLRALPIFEDVDDAQLERLAAGTSEFEAPAGQALIERGKPGSGMFVLEEGQAVVEASEGK